MRHFTIVKQYFLLIHPFTKIVPIQSNFITPRTLQSNHKSKNSILPPSPHSTGLTRDCLQAAGEDVTGEQLHDILREIDTNMNGQVELDEYLQVH